MGGNKSERVLERQIIQLSFSGSRPGLVRLDLDFDPNYHGFGVTNIGDGALCLMKGSLIRGQLWI